MGLELPTLAATHTLEAAVRYAGASGDFNPLHYDPEVAAEVSPTGGIIAHGMYAMGLASRLVTGWAGGPERILEIGVRFTRPWPLGATATFGGRVADVAEESIVVELWAETDDQRILKGTARVRRS